MVEKEFYYVHNRDKPSIAARRAMSSKYIMAIICTVCIV